MATEVFYAIDLPCGAHEEPLACNVIAETNF